ncbi:ABC transporter substrate binding protein [Thermodesulfobacteriota bacterium]
MLRPFLVLIFLLFTITEAVFIPLAAASSGGGKEVLYLDSYQEGYLWSDNILRGIRSVLKGKDIKLYCEHMDTKRIHDPEYFQLLFDLYKHKFTNTKFDAIICSDDNAFQFLLKNHKVLFPGVPVVFCGVNLFEDHMLDGHEVFTGVIEAFDLRSTISVALQINPGVEKVIAITDTTKSGKLNGELLSNVRPGFPKSVEFVVWDDWTVERLKARMSELDANSAVLPLSMFNDADGNYVSMPDSVETLSKVSKAPMYGTWDFLLGRGIVGGMITSGFNQGKTATELALRILNGERPSNISVIKNSPNQYMFDYTQLRRFGMNPDSLPPGSVIINRPANWYTVQKELIWGGGLLITLLAVGVVILGVHIRYRRKSEQDLRDERDKFQRFLDVTGVIIVVLDARGDVVLINRKGCRILQVEADEIVGKNWFANFLPERDRSVVKDAFDTFVSGETAQAECFENHIVTRNGEERVVAQ